MGHRKALKLPTSGDSTYLNPNNPLAKAYLVHCQAIGMILAQTGLRCGDYHVQEYLRLTGAETITIDAAPPATTPAAPGDDPPAVIVNTVDPH